FFSSRRRHTRFSRDWSSDVCSSDLIPLTEPFLNRTCYTGEVSKAHLDQTVTLFGWVHRRRDHGGVIFIDLRDRAGLAQVVVDPRSEERRVGKGGRAGGAR